MTDVLDAPEAPSALDKTYFTDVGLRLDLSGIPFSTWERMGDNLIRMSNGHQWWLGDWFLKGTEEYGDEKAYSVFGIDFNEITIQEYVRVASVYPYGKRRKKLSWSHHQAAAALPEDLRYQALAWAENNGVNGFPAPLSALREHIKEIKLAQSNGSSDTGTTSSSTTTTRSQLTYRCSFALNVEHEEIGDAIWEELIETMERLVAAAEVDARFENAKS